jgi:bifunctional non-homologous end joining protein LigD
MQHVRKIFCISPLDAGGPRIEYPQGAVVGRRVVGIHADTRDIAMLERRVVDPAANARARMAARRRQSGLRIVREDRRVSDLSNDGGTSRTRKARSRASMRNRVRGITITHPDREVYPGTGIRKKDVVAYYDAVMDWFLPGVIDRPMPALRCPDGVGADRIFRKQVTRGALRHVGSVTLTEQGGRRRTYVYPADARSVIELVQFDTLEFHPWGCKVQDTTRADRIVFDMDPGEDVAWSRVVAAVRLVGRRLETLGLVSFVRSTGGKGLHVVVPLNPSAPWGEARGFAGAFAAAMVAAQPEEFTAVSTPSRRRGCIYVDYLRNSRGATSIASYSLRARRGAPVAVPLRWSELGKVAGPGVHDLHAVLQRLRRLRSDPWEGMDAVRQSLQGALEALAGRA